MATSGVGVAVRPGTPKIDVATSDGIRKALLAAKSIAYSTGPNGLHVAALIAKWGLTDQLRARGDAQIGFQLVSELLPIRRRSSSS